MLINPITLKALIDTQIINETVDFAITPAEVGGRIKDAIDYTTEQIATVSATPDATTLIKGKIKLAGDLAGTADLPTVPALINKESLANKSLNVITDAASDIKYPSVKAVKTYVDANIGGGYVTKVLKTTILSADILQLFTTPITILTNNDPLTIKLPVALYMKKTTGTEYTMSSAQTLELRDSTNNVVNSLSSQFLTVSGNGFSQSNLLFNNNSVSSLKMGDYKLKLQSTNPTLGTCNLEVYVVYNEITL